MVKHSIAIVLVRMPKASKLKLNRLKALAPRKTGVHRGKYQGGGFIYYK